MLHDDFILVSSRGHMSLIQGSHRVWV